MYAGEHGMITARRETVAAHLQGIHSMNKFGSESIVKISAALVKAQSELKHAVKDSRNPHFNSKYADLCSIVEAIRQPLSSNGICYTQLISEDGNNLITMLIHAESGEYFCSYFPIIADKRTAQAIGSAVTYAKRYSLSAIVGLATDEDDDGNAAASRPQPPQQQDAKPLPKKIAATPEMVALTKKVINDASILNDECDFIATTKMEYKDFCEQAAKADMAKLKKMGAWILGHIAKLSFLDENVDTAKKPS